MKIANVVIKKTFEEMAGETRKAERTLVRILPVEVASIATEATFIPLAEEIHLGDHDAVTSIISVQPDLNYFKDSKPAELKPAKGFEFVQKKFSTVAVVELQAGTIRSHDAFVQSESYGPQVGLIPLAGEIELPTGAKFAGVIECEGYAISAQDGETGQEYRLGYRFAADDDVDWVALAFTRRKHWKRSEKNDASEDVKAPAYSSAYFSSGDAQVIARVAQKFGPGKKLPNGKVGFNLPSFEAWEQCNTIEREITQRRQKALSERDFEALEALQ